LLASRTVVAALSGLPVRSPRRASAPFVETAVARIWAVDETPADVEIPSGDAPAYEQAYLEKLFDPRRVRGSW
jgi:hypothetical protein